jgi:hypothetical protein
MAGVVAYAIILIVAQGGPKINMEESNNGK